MTRDHFVYEPLHRPVQSRAEERGEAWIPVPTVGPAAARPHPSPQEPNHHPAYPTNPIYREIVDGYVSHLRDYQQ